MKEDHYVHNKASPYPMIWEVAFFGDRRESTIVLRAKDAAQAVDVARESLTAYERNEIYTAGYSTSRRVDYEELANA